MLGLAVCTVVHGLLALLTAGCLEEPWRCVLLMHSGSLVFLFEMVLETYISKKGEQALLRYKYSGSDASYYFQYVVSPLAAALVDRLPRWLAPNAIPLFAFSLHVGIYYLVHTGDSAPAPWLCWLSAAATAGEFVMKPKGFFTGWPAARP